MPLLKIASLIQPRPCLFLFVGGDDEKTARTSFNAILTKPTLYSTYPSPYDFLVLHEQRYQHPDPICLRA